MAKIAAKRKAFKAKITALKERLQTVSGDLVDSKRKAILSLEINDLVQQTKDGSLDPVDVLQAYQVSLFEFGPYLQLHIIYAFLKARALVCTSQTNAICDFIDEALEIATNLKQIPVSERGPLFGVPVSVKECFYVKGYDHTIGLARFIGCPAQQDGGFVQVTIEALMDLRSWRFVFRDLKNWEQYRSVWPTSRKPCTVSGAPTPSTGKQPTLTTLRDHQADRPAARLPCWPKEGPF